MLLPITLTITGAAALINAWLALRGAQLHAGAAGDEGSQPSLAQQRALALVRARAQADFAQYAPLVLILIGLIEYARGPGTWLWLVGIVFLVARILHAFGMDRPAPNPLRRAGGAVTLAVMIGLALYAILLPYGIG